MSKILAGLALFECSLSVVDYIVRNSGDCTVSNLSVDPPFGRYLFHKHLTSFFIRPEYGSISAHPQPVEFRVGGSHQVLYIHTTSCFGWVRSQMFEAFFVFGPSLGVAF